MKTFLADLGPAARSDVKIAARVEQFNAFGKMLVAAAYRAALLN
jgi:hypothetical protein